LINNILAKIQANDGNAEDAVMLDGGGFVSETNATNIFMVKNGRVLTPHADYCLPGITRQTVIDLVMELGEKCINAAIIPIRSFVSLVTRLACEAGTLLSCTSPSIIHPPQVSQW